MLDSDYRSLEGKLASLAGGEAAQLIAKNCISADFFLGGGPGFRGFSCGGDLPSYRPG